MTAIGARQSAALVIVLSALIFSIPLYLTGGLGPYEDELIQYYPSLTWLGQCLRSGEFPIWNPQAYAGYPAFADPQSGILYPPNYIFAILPARLAYPTMITAAYLLAGFGMYRLGRSWKLARASAVLGALAWMYSGFLTGHRTHLTMLTGAAYLAVILWLWTRMLDGRIYRFLWLVVLAQALQILAGHFQITVFTMMISLPYGLIYSSRNRGRFFIAWLASWMLAFGLGAIQIIGSVHILLGSVREAGGFRFLTEGSFFPMVLPIAIAPALLGLRVPNAVYSDKYFGPAHHCEVNCFTGIVVLVLALAILFSRPPAGRQRRIVIFLGILALAGLFFALGRHNPTGLYKLIAHVPILRSFRSPARYLMWFNFAIASLAMFGLGGLQASGRAVRPRTLIKLTGSIVAILALFLITCRALLGIWGEYFSSLIPDGHEHVLATVKGALTILNPAIWIPLLIAALLIVCLRWVSVRRLPVVLIALALCEFATISPFYDIHIPPTNIAATKPAAAAALERLAPGGRNHLILPLGRDPYMHPLDYLHPFCNLMYDRATLTGYGPFLPKHHRRLFGFELWPTSSRYLDVITRPDLLARMGTTYLVAEPDIARQIDDLITVELPASTETVRQIGDVNLRAGRPSEIKLAHSPGLYRLRFLIRRAKGEELTLHCDLEGIDDPTWQGQHLLLRPWDANEDWRLTSWTFYIPPGQSAEPRLTIKADRCDASIKAATITAVPLPIDWLKPLWRSPAGAAIYRNTNSTGRIYPARKIRWVASPDRAIDEILADSDPETTWLAANGTDQDHISASGPAKILRTKWYINKIEAEVEVATDPAAIVIADTYHPGWHAKIDGVETEIFAADGMLKAIIVNPGKHKIELTFLPQSFTLGAAVSGISLLAVIALALIRNRRRSEQAVNRPRA